MDRDTFVQFAGGSIGHCNTELNTPFLTRIGEGFSIVKLSTDTDDSYINDKDHESASHNDSVEEEIPGEVQEMNQDASDDEQDDLELFDDSVCSAAS